MNLTTLSLVNVDSWSSPGSWNNPSPCPKDGLIIPYQPSFESRSISSSSNRVHSLLQMVSLPLPTSPRPTYHHHLSPSPTFAATLMSHAQLAHYLCIQETVPQEFYQIHFPRLVVFHLGNLNQLTKSKGVFWNSAKFFRLNLTIQDVIIRSENVSSNKCFGSPSRRRFITLGD